MKQHPNMRPVASKRAVRHLGQRLHRWLGLTFGAVLVVVGLTGTVFVFHTELGEWLEPELRTVNVPAGAVRMPGSELAKQAEAATPPGTRLRHLAGPESLHSVVTATYTSAPGTPEREVVLCLDPYTGRSLGQSHLNEDRLWRACEFLFELHYSLAVPRAGGVIVGLTAVFGLISIGTGVFLWWPGIGRLKSALVIHRRGGRVRRHFDIHRVSGVVFSLVLGALLLSGVWMNFNGPFVTVVQWFSPGTCEQPDPQDFPADVPPAGRTAAEILHMSESEFPNGRLNWLSVPTEPGDMYVVSHTHVPGSIVSQWSERIEWRDPVSGVVRFVQSPEHRRTRGEAFLGWQWPLHSGKAFGWPGRLMVALAGFIPLILYITGLALWNRQRLAQRKREPVREAKVLP